jgi:hypothetical protein
MQKRKAPRAASGCGDILIEAVFGKPSARGDGQGHRAEGCSSPGIPRWIAGVLTPARYRNKSPARRDVSPSTANFGRVGFGQTAFSLALSISSATGTVGAPFSEINRTFGSGSEKTSELHHVAHRAALLAPIEIAASIHALVAHIDDVVTRAGACPKLPLEEWKQLTTTNRAIIVTRLSNQAWHDLRGDSGIVDVWKKILRRP